MDGSRPQWRLAAVLAMDIAGFSRLMGADEEGTYRRIKSIFSTVVAPTVAAFQGRIFEKTGDGALVDFNSVVDAVRCAVEIQRNTSADEAHFAAERQIRFRMGICLGDVLVDQGQVRGGGVDDARKLEALAEPGGIVVSETAARLTEHLGYQFDNPGLIAADANRPIKGRALATLAGDGVSFGTSALQGGTPSGTTVPGFGHRPAIAVLPFEHSDNPDEAQFADGITEDLIVALARWRSFPVISRNSVFAFKGQNLDRQTFGRRLGARYVVDGSIRRVGSRLRAATHLLDVESGQPLSTGQYEYDIPDIFAVQDKMVRDVVGALEPDLLQNEQERARRLKPYDVDAYTSYHRAVWHHYRYTKEDNIRAQRLFVRALTLDPDYVQAAANFAVCLVHSVQTGWSDTPNQALDRALALARYALRADSRHPMGHFASGAVYRMMGQLEPALAAYAEAIRLNPSYAAAHAGLAHTYNDLNRPDEALPHIELALRLSPHDPRRFLWVPGLVASHYLAGRYLKATQEALAAMPDFPGTIRFAVAGLGQLGFLEQARALLAKLRRLDGNLAGTMAYFKGINMIQPAQGHIEAGLKKAGWT